MVRDRTISVLGPACGILVLVASARAQLGVPITAPAPLNTNTGSDNGHDSGANATTDGLGNWVAVWMSRDSLGGTIGTDSDILVARSTDNGVTWTATAPLNTNAGSDSGGDFSPQVTTDGLGNWVAVWWSSDSLGGTIGTDRDILVARSTDNGVTWTTPALLNTNAGSGSDIDLDPQVTTDGLGNWVAAWWSQDDFGGTIGTDRDILVARSTDNGVTWTAPALLNTNGESDSGGDEDPQVATDGLGNWVAVWSSKDDLGGTIGTDSDILVARSMDNGVTWTAPAPLNTNAGSDTGLDFWPQVTTNSLGNWVAVWYSDDDFGGTIGTDEDILVARSTDNGVTWTAPAPLNTNAGSDSGRDFFPEVTAESLGNWVAVWISEDDLGGTIGTDRDILVARSTDNGVTWTAPVPLNTNAGSDSGRDDLPQVTTDGLGNWVAVWHSDDDLSGTLGTDEDILVARFQIGQVITLPLDIRPGGCPNGLNRKSKGLLPMTLLGTVDFDVATIDAATLELSRGDGVGGSVGPVDGPPGPHPVVEDVGTPFDGEGCDCHDLGGDGIDDLSLKFDVEGLVSALQLNEMGIGPLVELVVSGELSDGSAFVGKDCVRLVPAVDVDADGDVDGSDFAFFAACFNKAGNPPRGGCSAVQIEAFDSDDDGDVDGVDFAQFAQCFNGAGNPPRTVGCR